MKTSCSYLGEWMLDRASVAIPPHLAHSEGRFAASPFPEGGESREIVDTLNLTNSRNSPSAYAVG